MPAIVVITESAEQTQRLGEAVGRLLQPGDVVLLHGDLGAGKTTLTQGLARGLGIAAIVQSPTFTLVAEHEGTTPDGAPVRLYHLDLYRLAGDDDLDSFGWDQFLAPTDGIVIVEWPERAGPRLPDEYLLVRLDPAGPSRRRIALEAIPANGRYSDVVARFADGIARAPLLP